MNRRASLRAIAAAALAARLPARAAGDLPLFDAHIHYSHDAWELVPPKQAVQILRQAGLRGAFVLSSNDQGTQMLLAEAPDLIVPELRPYRTRADTSGWVRDDGIVRYMEERLAKYRYVGVGESTFMARTPNCRCRGAWWPWRASAAWCCMRIPMSRP